MQNLKWFAKYAKQLAGPEILQQASRPRGLYSSKRGNGRVMVIAGSREYHGSPVLAANAVHNTLAALRIGTGYAYLFAPKAIETAVRKLSPNIIVRGFGTNYISDGDMGLMKKELGRIDALVIGMGIGRNEETLWAASKIIDCATKMGIKLVIDADAIYALRYAHRLNHKVIITPQDREFRELSGATLSRKALAERISKAIATAKRLNTNILLKGHDTVVTDGKAVKVVKSESSALATMGTGDVLSGMIGGYAAIGCSMFVAGVAGAYLHSLIGDLLAVEKGTHILATDVVDYIPRVIKEFDKKIV